MTETLSKSGCSAGSQRSRGVSEMPGRDTKTRYQGVFARHKERCKVTETGNRRDCNCSPRYYGVAWDREAAKPDFVSISFPPSFPRDF
jgi:hypothetical protein